MLTMKQLLSLLFLSACWLPLLSPAEVDGASPAVPAMAVRIVHPDNEKLVSGRKPAPAGYTACIYEFRGYDGKMVRERLFLKDTPVITEEEVVHAQADPDNPGHINITLSTRGGRTMKETTSSMKLGHDRLAIVVQGKVNSAPVVQAILSNALAISGLDGEHEADNLAELLNRRAAAERATPFTPRDLALYAVHPDSDRLVKEGKLSIPGYRLWSRPAPGEEKNGGKKEYLFLGDAPIVTGNDAQAARSNLDYPGHLNIVWNGEAARKLEQACSVLRPGKDRLAVVLRGHQYPAPAADGAAEKAGKEGTGRLSRPPPQQGAGTAVSPGAPAGENRASGRRIPLHPVRPARFSEACSGLCLHSPGIPDQPGGYPGRGTFPEWHDCLPSAAPGAGKTAFQHGREFHGGRERSGCLSGEHAPGDNNQARLSPNEGASRAAFRHPPFLHWHPYPGGRTEDVP